MGAWKSLTPTLLVQGPERTETLNDKGLIGDWRLKSLLSGPLLTKRREVGQRISFGTRWPQAGGYELTGHVSIEHEKQYGFSRLYEQSSSKCADWIAILERTSNNSSVQSKL
jgi:hypothetical protein